MTIATRLDQAMREAGVPSQSALARASGIPQPTIARILNGTGKRGPEAHTLKALAAACNVNFVWLHEGIGPKARTESHAEGMQLVTVAESGSAAFARVPLVTAVRLHGGLPGFAVDSEEIDAGELMISQRWIDEKGLSASMLYAIKVKGDSMYPTIRNGNTVVINTADRRPVDGEYFAVLFEGAPVIKRLEREGTLWYLASDNPEPRYGRRAATDVATVIIGRMVKLERDFI